MSHPIKDYSDYQVDWASLVRPLRRGRYVIRSADFLPTIGDAPKNFLLIQEYRPGHRTRQERWTAYIAKVGHKFYPIESVTEHLVTRLGQLLGVDIADSQLRIVAKQVRFLSKYFLRPKERLVHGPQLFKRLLDDAMVEEIAEKRMEAEFYTFQMVREAVEHAYPKHYEQIMLGFVEMLGFDAIVGQNDRHPSNWGIIEPISTSLRPRFSPVYDSARALFWRMEEDKIKHRLSQPKLIDNYINKSQVVIGWDHIKGKISHFDLIQLIWRSYPLYRSSLERFVLKYFLRDVYTMIDEEFRVLMSAARRALIKICLKRRYEKYRNALS